MAGLPVPYGTGYPLWFRQRIAQAEGTPEERAAQFGVHVSTIYRHHRLFLQTGSFERLPARGGAPRATTAVDEARLHALTLARPDILRDEARRVLGELSGRAVTVWSISRMWKRLSFTSKRLRTYARARDEQRRVNFFINPPVGPHGVAGIYGIPTMSMIDVDEAGIQLQMVDRVFGHAPRGRRASMPGWVRFRCVFCMLYGFLIGFLTSHRGQMSSSTCSWRSTSSSARWLGGFILRIPMQMCSRSLLSIF